MEPSHPSKYYWGLGTEFGRWEKSDGDLGWRGGFLSQMFHGGTSFLDCSGRREGGVSPGLRFFRQVHGRRADGKKKGWWISCRRGFSLSYHRAQEGLGVTLKRVVGLQGWGVEKWRCSGRVALPNSSIGEKGGVQRGGKTQQQQRGGGSGSLSSWGGSLHHSDGSL